MAERIFLSPGEVYFGGDDGVVETVLGSCVAIVFWHPQRKLGGVCHYLLPQRKGSVAPSAQLDGRYGDEALRQLLEHVAAHHTEVSDYVVKVFGGSRTMSLTLPGKAVGKANVDFALSSLKQHQIKVAAQDLAGDGYRYLRFDLSNGDVWVRHGSSSVDEGRA